VEFLNDSVDTGKSGIVKARKTAGATPGGETWAHWQLALAYATVLRCGLPFPTTRATVWRVPSRSISGMMHGFMTPPPLLPDEWLLSLPAKA
jgi:hypothetical protein